MKIFKSFLPALIIAALPLTSAFGISVTVDAEPLQVTTPPVMENGTTLVPMRAIFEALGMTLNWDDATKTATATNDDTEIKLTLGSTTAYVDGKATTLSVPAKSINGSTMVPVRFISEALGNTIDWNGEDQAVNVYSFDLSQLKPDEQKFFRILTSSSNKLVNVGEKLQNMNEDDIASGLSHLRAISSSLSTSASQLEAMKLEDAELDKIRIESIAGFKGMSSAVDKMVKAIESEDEAMMNQAVSEFEAIISK